MTCPIALPDKNQGMRRRLRSADEAHLSACPTHPYTHTYTRASSDGYTSTQTCRPSDLRGRPCRQAGRQAGDGDSFDAYAKTLPDWQAHRRPGPSPDLHLGDSEVALLTVADAEHRDQYMI
jgi:hypothetical protein